LAKLTPVQEALHVLRWNPPRSELLAAQPDDDRLKPDRKCRRPWAGEMLGFWRGGSFRPLAGTGSRGDNYPSVCWPGFMELPRQPSLFFHLGTSQPWRITRESKTP
jgi:hypothetical protein